MELLNIKYPDLQPLAIREKVAFTYEKNKATWTDGGLERETTWAAPP